jgi:bacillolysin
VHRHPSLLLHALTLGALALPLVSGPSAAAGQPDPVDRVAGATYSVPGNQVTDPSGRTRLVGATSGTVVAAARPGAGPVSVALAHLAADRGALPAQLGLARRSGLRSLGATRLAGRQDAVRFQQTVDGVPVVGGQLVTVLRDDALLSVSGEGTAGVVSAAFGRTAGRAARTAREATARAHDLPVGTLRATRPGRWLYDASLVQPGGAPGAHAVWRVTVTSRSRPDVRELVLVDAARGDVALQVDQVAHVLDRVVCDSAGVPADAYVCKAGRYDRVEGQGPIGIADADQAFDNTGATATWFETRLGVDLTDLIGYDRGDGRKLRSTTRYCPSAGCPFENAAWTGDQMVYGEGYTVADDVVAHELGHGVTQQTSGLMYWFQSGAINESMSDVMGELVDLTDGTGTDTDLTRWQLGEDLPPRAGGIARDMSDPTAYGQPDHTSSNLYEPAFDYADNGGVHTNSGVPNKTAYLIVDGTAAEPGGIFNGRSFAGIGSEKAAVLYWTVMRTLTPGSDFADLAAVLAQSCANLAGVGAAGITAADCATVQAATTATGLTRWQGPSAPRNVSMRAGVRSVRLSWDRPASEGSSPLSSYAVHVHPAVQGTDFVPVEPGARSVIIGGLPAGRDYRIGLVAVTADGTSPAVVRTLSGSELRVDWPSGAAYGTRLRLAGRLVDADGHGLAGRTVHLLRRPRSDGGWETVASDTAGSTGAFVLPSRPSGTARYAIVYDGTRRQLGDRTTAHVLPLRQRVSLGVDPTLRVGATAVFRGTVAPARTGGAVRLQRRAADGRWRTVRRGTLDGSSGYRLTARMPGRQPSVWRIWVAPPPHGPLAAGISREVTLRPPS